MKNTFIKIMGDRWLMKQPAFPPNANVLYAFFIRTNEKNYLRI